MKLKEVLKVPVSKLKLDYKNPRLIHQSVEATNEAIITRLYRDAQLDELLDSISSNGYLDIEPLIAIQDAESEKLVVLEGNRRLAALCLLRDPELVKRIRKKEKLSIKIPTIEKVLKNTFEEVSVYCVGSREDARSFIGFKHVNGPAKWDSYAKARFAAEWYKQPQEGDLSKIAKAIGDGHETIKRMVSAIYVLDQAQENELFDIDDRFTPKLNFSHLYTALSRASYMKYLGLDPKWGRYDPEPNPLSSDKLNNLKQLLVWIYGSKQDKIQPVIQSQNPDVKRLGEVLETAEALHILETSGVLDRAHAATEPVDIRFIDSLLRARSAINDTAASLRAYDGHDSSLLDVAADVKETAGVVHQRMLEKNQKVIDAE